MDATPTGAALFYLADDKSHYDAGHNRSQNIKQELLHRHHLLVTDSEDCPTDFLDYFRTKAKYLFSDILEVIS